MFFSNSSAGWDQRKLTPREDRARRKSWLEELSDLVAISSSLLAEMAR
jgi:hypothetical protein